METHDLTAMFLALGVLLAAARGLGELARRCKQPEVLGEILAGIILGPTIMGVLAPGLMAALFPTEGPAATALTGLTTLGITLFLLVAGLEVDLRTMRQHVKVAFGISLWGMLVPFALGFGVALSAPGLLEQQPRVSPVVIALFFGTALSISALPVIARVLMDLNIYRTRVGEVTIGAAFGDNLFGTIMFATILGVMGAEAQSAWGIGARVLVTLGFAAVMLTVVRGGVHRALPWIETHMSRSSGVLGFALCLTLLGAALSEALGVSAILGAFLVGVVVGDSTHFRQQTRAAILHFVSAFFAPLFFATIGLHVNFARSFDWALVLVVLALATAGKLVGCGLSARASGWTGRESVAIGFAMNARGAMEIVFGLLGYHHGIISERMLVALIVMAIATSMMSGPAMQRLLRLERPRRVVDYQGVTVFLQPLRAGSREGAIRELAQAAGIVTGIEAPALETSLLSSEFASPAPIAPGVAVAAAEVAGLTAPLVGVGVPSGAIDFGDSGEHADLLFIVLTPRSVSSWQDKLLADLARSLMDVKVREQVLVGSGWRDFLSRLKS